MTVLGRRRVLSGDGGGAMSSLYWGAWIGSQLTGQEPPWDWSAVTRFESMVGKPVSIESFGSPFADCSSSPCSMYAFPTTPFDTIRSHGAIPLLSWSSQSLPSSLTEPDYTLGALIGGRYDGYIRQFAEAAKQWGHPFFLRFDWEMNGDWFPWSEGVNGNRPGQYVAAWRHVHDIFASVGATNANWVWCPNVNPQDRWTSLNGLYPGNAYVDWTCLDGYNDGTDPAGPFAWQTFDQLYQSTYQQITAQIAPSKPMLIGEAGSTEDGGSKATWLSNMLSELPTKYPKIHGLVYFEQDQTTDLGTYHWPLESSESAINAFAQGISSPAYARNDYANLNTSPIPPPS